MNDIIIIDKIFIILFLANLGYTFHQHSHKMKEYHNFADRSNYPKKRNLQMQKI